MYSNEIQIEIDDVYGCPGHCPGCTLSTLEKKGNIPDMNFLTLENSIKKIKEYVPTLNNLEKINITYGIADHFLMSDEYLEKTYNLAASVIEDCNLKNEYNGVFYSASMIGKHENIIERVKFLSELSKKRGIPIYILAVLDPKNLLHKKFSEIYANNIIVANKLVKKVDLSINLSEEAISNISPLELFNFAKMNDFDEVTINWTPTEDNLIYTYSNNKKLIEWLINFDLLIEKDGKLSSSYRPVMIKTINNIKCKEPEIELDFYDNIKVNMPELLKKSIQIDHLGNLFPKYEAIGDVAHSPRLGFKEIGNINDNISISKMFDINFGNIEKNVIKQFKNKTCIDCKYNKYCSNTGFHIYTHILENAAKKNILLKDKIKTNIKNHNCIHIAKEMFDYYENKLIEKDKN